MMTQENAGTSGSSTSPDSGMPRRSFLGWIVGLGTVIGGGVAAIAAGFLSNSLRREVSSSSVRVAALDAVENTFKDFKILKTTQDAWVQTQTKHVIFLRREGDAVTALSGTCSHMGCTVAWKKDDDQFHCPCHAGIFDREGQVLEGPPPGPLQQLTARVEDGVVFVELPEVS